MSVSAHKADAADRCVFTFKPIGSLSVKADVNFRFCATQLYSGKVGSGQLCPSSRRLFPPVHLAGGSVSVIDERARVVGVQLQIYTTMKWESADKYSPPELEKHAVAQKLVRIGRAVIAAMHLSEVQTIAVLGYYRGTSTWQTFILASI